jgi:hypothetical protein
MTVTREIFWGWVCLVVSCLLMFGLAVYQLDALEKPTYLRVLALSAALSLCPGYAMVISAYLWLRGIRPEVTPVMGVGLIFTGMFVFGLPLSNREGWVDLLCIAVFFCGHAMVIPFARRNCLMP